MQTLTPHWGVGCFVFVGLWQSRATARRMLQLTPFLFFEVWEIAFKQVFDCVAKRMLLSFCRNLDSFVKSWLEQVAKHAGSLRFLASNGMGSFCVCKDFVCGALDLF